MPGYQKDRPPSKGRYIAAAIFAFFYAAFYSILPPVLISMLAVPLLVLMLFVIWALPVGDFQPPKALTVCFWLFFATMFLWPNYLALALPGLPWITVSRLFGGPLVLMLLICASASAPFRREMVDLLQSAGWIWKMIAVYSAIQFVAIFMSPDSFSTFSRTINQQIVWTGIFLVAVWVFRQPEKIRTWGRLLIALAVFVSIIGEVEARYQMVLWANSIPPIFQIEDPAVQRILAGTERNGIYRIVSTSMNPLSLAEFLALATPFIIHEFRLAKTASVKFLLVCIDILVIHAIILTDARLGLVGALATHSVYGLVWMFQKWRSERGSLIGPAITLAYPAILAVVAGLVLAVPRLRVSILGGGRQQSSNDAREQQFDAMPDVFLQSPVFGFGSGQGGPRLGFSNAGGQLTIDSYLLSAILDYGSIGFICFFGLVIGGGAMGARIAIHNRSQFSSYGIPIALFMLALLLIRFVLSNEFNLPLLFMMLGALVGLNAYERKLAGPAEIAHRNQSAPSYRLASRT